MGAQIIQFPRRDRGTIRVCCEGDWLVIYDGRAWPLGSREAALQEANELAAQINAVIIVEASSVRWHGCKGERAYDRTRTP